MDRIDSMISATGARCIVNFSDVREYSQDSVQEGELNFADRYHAHELCLIRLFQQGIALRLRSFDSQSPYLNGV